MTPRTTVSAILGSLGIIGVVTTAAQAIGANVFWAATIGGVLGGGYGYSVAMPVPFATLAGMTNALTIFGIFYYQRHADRGLPAAWLLLVAIALDAAVFVAQRRVKFRVKSGPPML